MNLQSYRASTRAALLQLVRSPEFIVPTLALPVSFFVLFGNLMPSGDGPRLQMLARFGVFATMGPALFAFGAGVAQERERSWWRLMQVSPAPAAVHLVSKAIATWVMVAGSIALIYLAAVFWVGLTLPMKTWALLTLVHLVSATPFVLIGLTLGFVLRANAAIAAANLVMFALAVLGGLWFPLTYFPSELQTVALALPSYHLGEIARVTVGLGQESQLWWHALAALGLTALAAGAAHLAWHRQPLA